VVVPTLFEVMNDAEFPAGPFGDDPDYDSVERGRIQERDYWAEVGRRRPDLDIGSIMQTCLYVRSEIKTMFADLGGSIRIAGLTNDMGHWFGPNWGQRFPEMAAFDLLLEAGRSGMLKPDPSVFRWALEQLGERPSDCLFVDDLPVNLRGARAAGMQTEHFDATDPAGSVERILLRLGVSPAVRSPRVFGRT
jgi:FMN phosphatase YigB (HAD superfamily)